MCVCVCVQLSASVCEQKEDSRHGGMEVAKALLEQGVKRIFTLTGGINTHTHTRTRIRHTSCIVHHTSYIIRHTSYIVHRIIHLA